MNEQCWTYEEMAACLHRTVPSILARRHVLGLKLPKRSNGWTEGEDAILRKGVEAGLPQDKIAEMVGRSPQAVSSRMFNKGISYKRPLYEIETPTGFKYQTRELSSFVQTQHGLFRIPAGLSKDEIKSTKPMVGLYTALRTQKPWKGWKVRILEDGNHPKRRKKDDVSPE